MSQRQIRTSPRVVLRRTLVSGTRGSVSRQVLENASSSRLGTSSRGVATTSAGVRARPRATATATLTATGRTTNRNVTTRTTGTSTMRPAATARPGRPSSSASTTRVTTRRSTANQAVQGEDKSVVPVSERVPKIVPFSNSTNLNDERSPLAVRVPCQFICPICFLNAKEEGNLIFATKCGHLFCNVCLLETYNKKKVCPMCQQPMHCDDFREIFLNF